MQQLIIKYIYFYETRLFIHISPHIHSLIPTDRISHYLKTKYFNVFQRSCIKINRGKQLTNTP